MPMLDDLVEEFKKDDSVVVTENEQDTPAPEEKPEEKPVETPEEKPEEKPEDTPEEKPEDKPAPAPQPKPDLSTLTKEQKAEHAFKRQLSKQRERHEAEIKDLKDSFQKQFDDLKNSLKQPEPVKTRADFPLDKGGDDAYIAYLTKKGVDEALAEQKAEQEKANAEKAEQDKEEAKRQQVRDEMTRSFSANSHATFKDEASFNAFSAKVNNALANGLGEVLDSVPAVRDFVFRNPEGPIVLDKMLSSEGAFTKVMSQTDPTMMIIAAHELAREQAPAPAPAPAPAAVPQVVHMGKPGARGASSDAGSMFNSDKDLLAYVRGVGTRGRR